MAVTCLKCGYTMKSKQEVWSAVIAAFHTVIDAVNALGPVIVAVLKGSGGKVGLTAGATAGISAALLNNASRPVPCPKCDAIRSWEDGGARPAARRTAKTAKKKKKKKKAAK